MLLNNPNYPYSSLFLNVFAWSQVVWIIEVALYSETYIVPISLQYQFRGGVCVVSYSRCCDVDLYSLLLLMSRHLFTLKRSCCGVDTGLGLESCPLSAWERACTPSYSTWWVKSSSQSFLFLKRLIARCMLYYLCKDQLVTQLCQPSRCGDSWVTELVILN